ncbi:MAG: amylo-alpha-1,6-glucosidase [Rubrobacter sp.]|nr:amylo-alpha-1,6-glucosidase [Rubrobacter sp.]
MPDNDAGLKGGVASVVSPGAYAVSDEGGDFDGDAGQGLYYRDMRHLSGFVLRVNGEFPEPEGFRDSGPEADFRLASSGLRILRRRRVGAGMEETLEVSNRSEGEMEAVLSLECSADFRDVYEVRDYARPSVRGEISEEVGEGCLRFAYRREDFSRGTVVRVSGGDTEAVAEPGRISCACRLGSGESKVLRVTVSLEEGGREVRLRESAPLFGAAPRLETGWGALRESWERSVVDLESLSFDAGEGLLVPAAGAPWFMALFGRDSLITAYQTMILSPEPAKNALRALARWQAEARDDFTDAEPGKIPHELRVGELAFFGESPETPYYGTADATPLFLILLHEVWRWTGDDAFVREMEGVARAALAWVLDEADKVSGYVAYETRSTTGLQNQGWKDSANSMLFRDGTLAEGSIALCEVQGYVYDAFLRTAKLAGGIWDDERLARDLGERAAELKARFDCDFWMPERGYFALALDHEGRRVDSITSNAGHLLWSGIVPEDKARLVADRLAGNTMFSGWGIRTMAVGEGGYDPDSYHNGSVWPHDNALIAGGLRRYGFREEANRVARALLDAAPHFDHRLPEVFGGHPREEGRGPVEYPTSCSPQAWAAGTIPLLVRAMLGIEPDPETRTLLSAPVVPEAAGDLRLEGVPAFGESSR